MKKSLKKLMTVLRFGIALAIIAYLLYRMDISQLSEAIGNAAGNWPWLLVAFMTFFVCLCMGMVRWKLLLNAQEINLTWRRTFMIYFIGQFFNAFLIGATGGDIARVYYTAKESHHKKTETVITVVIDRLAGMISLLIIIAACLLFRRKFFLDNHTFRILYFFMWVMVASVVCGGILLFNLRLLKNRKLARRILDHHLVGPMIKRVSQAFGVYRHYPLTLAVVMGLSISAHLLVLSQCYSIGNSLHIDLPFIDYITTVPIIMFISAVPITPGGVGLREYLSIELLGSIGVSQAQAFPLSLMIYFMALLWSLFGGLMFICYSASSGHTIKSEMDKLREESEAENADVWVPGPHEQDDVS